MPLPRRLAVFDPRRSLRARFAFVLGISGLALALVASLLVERVQRSQIEASVGQSLHRQAQVTVRALTASLRERLALLRQMASQPVLASGLMEPGDVRTLLESLRGNQPEFAWVALVDAAGEVQVATNALLQGERLVGHPALENARVRPWIGQRHPAGPLAAFMPLTRDGEPPHFITLAAPVVDFQGQHIGVLLAELDWAWVRERHDELVGNAATEQGVSSLLLGRAGTVDIGPAELLGQPSPISPSALPPMRAGPVLRWPDGRDYLTAAAHEPDAPGVPGAGFTLLVRQEAEVAFAAAQALRQQLQWGGSLAALAFMALSAWLASRVARPIRALSQVAARRQKGEDLAFPPAPRGRADEVAQLTDTLRAMDADMRRRHERYQTLFEGSIDAMYVRVNGQLEMANAACLRLFGAQHMAQLRDRPVFELFHPDERDAIAARIHRLTVLREAVPLIEQRIHRLDGVWVDVEVTALPFNDASGPGIQVVLRDITERKRAREAVRRSEERFQLALSGTQTSVWEIDLRSGEPYLSPNGPGLLGLDPAQLPADRDAWRRLLHPDDRGSPSAEFAHLMAGELDRAERVLRLRHRSGHHVELLVRAFLVRGADGTPERVIGTAQDMTERHRAERLLRQKDRLLAQTGRLARLGAWSFEIASGRGQWTEEVAAIYGQGADTPVHRAQLLAAVPATYRDTLLRAFVAAAETGAAFDLVLPLAAADGQWRWARVLGRGAGPDDVDDVGADATGAARAITRVEGVMQDVTALHQAQAEIESLNADLERRVEARTAQLRAANAELDSFAYAVSHDLRAPLRAMNGFAQALEEDYGAQLDHQARGFLDQIKLASQRMGGLIDGLLALSRSARGRLRRDTVDLSRLADNALRELRAGEPQREVTAVIAPGLQARGDARMLDAVMRNLVGNAWKYTARREGAHIEVGLLESEGLRWFFVRDNGVGFDMAHAGRLFKAFQRLHRADEFPGIGVGLATVQRIVRRHGGQIVADARRGEGAEFRFTLPEQDPDDDDEADAP